MVQNGTRKEASIDETALCTLCEMIAYWIQLQLKKQVSREQVFKHVTEVNAS